ncbi:MAG: hypothetical protein ACKO6N_12990 [Myxococcota bacterium]
MQSFEHDSIAKIIMGVLAAHRELLLEAELRVPAYGDILIRPGPPLQPATGLLGELIEQRLVLLEFFSARPGLLELVRVRAKGLLAWARELSQRSHLASSHSRRIVIVGIGCPSHALYEAWAPLPWQHLERGLWRIWDGSETRYVDLLRLPVNAHTAWLHVAGDSPWVTEALKLLRDMPDDGIQTLLARISEEIPHMQIQSQLPAEASTRRFLKAWEETLVLNQGKQEGEAKGLLQAITFLFKQRFPEQAESLLHLLPQQLSFDRFQQLAQLVLKMPSAEMLMEQMQASTEYSPSPAEHASV